MDDKKITAEELLCSCESDMKKLAQEVADSNNNARDGHIIADSEELVREATGKFRELIFQRALDNLQSKQDFSPEGSSK